MTPTVPADASPAPIGLLGIGSPRAPEFCSNCGHSAATYPIVLVTRTQTSVSDFRREPDVEADWCRACIEGHDGEIFER